MIKGSSLFSQLLHHFPRNEFARLVAKHQAERRSKGFSSWTARGIYFVTRQKENAVYEVIKLNGSKAQEKCPYPLRLIIVWGH